MGSTIDPAAAARRHPQLANEQLLAEMEKGEEFRKLVKELETMMETDAQRARRRAEEAKKAQEEKDKNKRIQELRSLIAKLKQKLAAAGGNDAGLAAQISMAETELFWLLSAF